MVNRYKMRMNRSNNVEMAVFLTNGLSKLSLQRLQLSMSSENMF